MGHEQKLIIKVIYEEFNAKIIEIIGEKNTILHLWLNSPTRSYEFRKLKNDLFISLSNLKKD